MLVGYYTLISILAFDDVMEISMLIYQKSFVFVSFMKDDEP